jgi:hypothetical protein
MTHKFFPGLNTICLNIWENFYNSIDHPSITSIDNEVKLMNGRLCYTPYVADMWVEFDLLEDLTYFILRWS